MWRSVYNSLSISTSPIHHHPGDREQHTCNVSIRHLYQNRCVQTHAARHHTRDSALPPAESYVNHGPNRAYAAGTPPAAGIVRVASYGRLHRYPALPCFTAVVIINRVLVQLEWPGKSVLTAVQDSVRYLASCTTPAKIHQRFRGRRQV